MALRSLVVMLKGLPPRRMPGSGAFAPKGNLWSKISARLTDPTKSGSVEETACPHLLERIKRLDQEERWRRIWADHCKTVLTSIVSIGCVKCVYAYADSNA